MAPKTCSHCLTERAVLKRPKTLELLCKKCFFVAFEDEVHQTIVSSHLFKRGERVALGASGGKDSTVLMHLMKLLNERHDYGLDLFLLSIDEGIAGYRDDSLDTVRTNEQQYGIPLKVVSYKELYGWTMDEIVAQIGTRNNCTYCGVFRRQALDRGAVLLGADKVATGHNADDVAETVLLNILRGDVARLGRCSSAITGEDSGLPRVKPFKYTYEKEIVMYAYFQRLTYFSTECLYAPFAARGAARDFVKDLEAARPSAILDIIRSAESFRLSAASTSDDRPAQQPRTCDRCHYMSSQPLCKACLLLEGLNRGLPGYGVRRMRGAEKKTSTALPAPSTAKQEEDVGRPAETCHQSQSSTEAAAEAGTGACGQRGDDGMCCMAAPKTPSGSGGSCASGSCSNRHDRSAVGCDAQAGGSSCRGEPVAAQSPAEAAAPAPLDACGTSSDEILAAAIQSGLHLVSTEAERTDCHGQCEGTACGDRMPRAGVHIQYGE